MGQVPLSPVSYADMGMTDDFGPLAQSSGAEKRSAADAALSKDAGMPRKWLKVFENLPSQLLNVYGEAKYHKSSDATLWAHMCEPLKSGASWASEWCDSDDGRRGVATNRWVLTVHQWCKTQLTPERKYQNEKVLNSGMFTELYSEIEAIFPALEYCLAPKKEFEKKGAAGMRSGATQVVSDVKDPKLLQQHAKTLYEWLDLEKPSRVRMLLHWQALGGHSYVASVYHRAAQVFRYHGNTNQEVSGQTISLEQFQAAVVSRHQTSFVEDGIAESHAGKTLSDFGALPSKI